MMRTLAPQMTVGDLIALLRTFPPVLPVMVEGYEGGFDYPFRPYTLNVALESDDPSYCGRYNRADLTDGASPFVALLIPRTEE